MRVARKLSLAALVLGFTPWSARAVNRFYTGESSTSWNDPANWSDVAGGGGNAGVPGSSDDAFVQTSAELLSLVVALDTDVSVTSVRLVTGATGSVALLQTANTLTASGFVQVQGGTTGSAEYDQEGGTVSAGSLKIVGKGEYNLAGGTLNASTVTNGGTLEVGGGAILNAGTISGSGTVQFTSSATYAGGTISQLLTTAASTTISKTTATAATIAGAQTYGAGSIYDAQAGTTTFQTPFGSSSSTANLAIHANSTVVHVNLAAGSIPVGSRISWAAGLTMNTPGEVVLDAGAQEVVGADGLSIDVADGGSMDVNDNTFILEDTDTDHNAAKTAQLTGWLASGYNGGAWSGLGIKSSAVALAPGHALGILSNDKGGKPIYSTFHGATVDAHSVLVQYTWAGDTNLDGTVNFTDLLVVAQNYNKTNTGWATGDFNYDGTTNFSDLLKLAQNYNKTSSLTAAQVSEVDAVGGSSFAAAFAQAQSEVAVPEAGNAAWALGGMVACVGRRRRRSAEC